MHSPNSVQMHLSLLVSETTEITREVVSGAENPVMLCSVGKDSAVMLQKSVLSLSPSVSADAFGYDLEIPRDL